MRLQSAFVVLALMGVASSSLARTWHVAQDGSGDFAVIQDAITAANAGDVIAIGPGNYDDYTFAWDNGQWDVYSCAFITKDNLTLQGAGQERTIIGFPHYDPSRDINGIGMIANQSLHVKDLTISGVRNGIYFEVAQLDVEGCTFTGCSNGILSWGGAFDTMRRCTFRDNIERAVLAATANVIITDCQIIGGAGGVELQGTLNGIVENCVFQGAEGCITLGDFGFTQITGCRMIGYLNGALYGTGSANACLVDNWIFAGNIGILWYSHGRFEGSDNVIEGCSTRTIVLSGTADVEFCGNHILPGPAPYVDARLWEGSCPGVCHLDFTGNYWGTDDPAAIAAGIIDYNDFNPPDPFHRAVVDFFPFEHDVVQTERTTWGTVKTMFR
jgi:hypothetical protein